MKMFKLMLLSCAVSIALISCSSEDDNNSQGGGKGTYSEGIFITNEGPFQNGTGTVTYISDDLSETRQGIYKEANGTDLGNVVQSMGFDNEEVFIVVNNSNKVVVAREDTFEWVTSIENGFEQPRFFAAANNKGYVSNWGDPNVSSDDFISVINLDSYTVDKEIPVVLGPEAVQVSGDFLYVAHKGGWGQNNLISVIDTRLDEVVTTIEVGDVPNSMVLANTDLWVLCGGTPVFAGTETGGRLVKINTTSNAIELAIEFNTGEHPDNLTSNGEYLYYSLSGGVYEFNTGEPVLPVKPVVTGNFYNLTANEGRLYGTDAGDYASEGSVTVFDLSNYSVIKTIETGIIPGGVYFND